MADRRETAPQDAVLRVTDADRHIAARRAAMPPGSERFLDTRSLHRDHRQLAGLLRPGMRVLDVGCGTGSITRGIAAAVAPDGMVLGIDIDHELIRRAETASEPNLRFAVVDLRHLEPSASFDVVTSARMLQWLADPLRALEIMTAATRPGGQVVVLDYDHTETSWEPELPAAAMRFFDAFLTWRADAGLDNAIAGRLPALFARAGLIDIEVADASESTRRGDPDFGALIELWPAVIATRGHQIVADGMLTECARVEAEQQMRRWISEEAQSQTLRLTSVTGRRPRSQMIGR